jgi:hypothetical protein
MSEWFEQFGGIEDIVPIDAAHLSAWPDAAFASYLSGLRYVPLVESELHLASHHLPLSLRRAPLGWEVVADLRSARVRRAAFSPSGEWQAGYKPLAIRMLPFVTSSTRQIFRLLGGEQPDIARNRMQMEAVQKHLITMYNGRKLVEQRAETLLAQGWLQRPAGDDIASLVPLVGSFSELAISSANWHAAELLMILAFSERHLIGQAPLRSMVLQKRRDTPETTVLRNVPDFLDWGHSLRFDL